ncbi:MAG: S9 family peptidase [Phycisphaerales bacterium]|nr:S9 family peptidase [Phycisphaerales bacterium]
MRSLVMAAITQATCFAALADDTQLIPRETLFGNPERAGVQISPDGGRIAFLAPLDDVLNVWVQSLDGGEPEAVTRSTDRPITNYTWAVNGEQILYMQDKGGNENTHVYAVDLASGTTTDLTPGDEVKASLVGAHRDRPDEILVMSNARVPESMDVIRMNIRSGDSTMVFKNDDGYVGMIPDDDWNFRVRARMTDDGGTLQEYRDTTDAPWRELDRVGLEDAMSTSVSGFDKTGTFLWGSDSRGGDTARFVKVTPQADGSFKRETVFESDKSDVADIMINPITLTPEAVAVNRLRKEWTILDPSIQPDLDALGKLVDGELEITDRSLDDRKWIAVFLVDDGPVQYWLWDRDKQEGTFLFTNRPELESLSLAKMMPVEIPSRDGLDLVSYLTLPVGVESKNLPMVVMVHGGPWARDNWGYNPYHQWLANRGYAVLSVNFRGSTGFGKAFLNAGNREWYHAMQDDINDAAQWAVDQGYADPDRMAIMGGSYGGYATLAGLTRDPELWACGVDIVGPSHVATLLSTIPAYWEPVKVMFEKRVGSLEETAWLDEISPLTHVANIKRPLLIGQGANDPRVKVSESDQIVEAMTSQSIPVTYVVFPDEGHGFAKPENNMAFNAITENFLARHLGGRAEAVDMDVADSTAQVRSLGGLALEGVEEWDPSKAPEKAEDPVVTLEDLTEEQQAQVAMMFQQIETQVPEQARRQAYPMILMQMKGSRAQVPESDVNVFLYVTQEMQRRIDALPEPEESGAPTAPAGTPSGG